MHKINGKTTVVSPRGEGEEGEPQRIVTDASWHNNNLKCFIITINV